MDKSQLREYIKADLGRMTSPTKKNAIKYLISNHSFKVIFWYRIGQAFPKFRPIINVIRKHYAYLTGIQIPQTAVIGKGITFPHFSCIIITCGVVIGENCTIFHGTTIGSVRGKAFPVIGDNVVISANCTIVGDVKIGNNVIIGAGSVVVHDIPDNAVAVGNPAKVISFDGPKHVTFYRNC